MTDQERADQASSASPTDIGVSAKIARRVESAKACAAVEIGRVAMHGDVPDDETTDGPGRPR